MLTPEFMRRMAAKRRAEKEAETQPEENLHVGRSYQPPPRSPKPKKRTTPEGKEGTSRARKAADARMLNQHGRTREEIDAILLRDYRTKGPTQLARELGMKVTTVMMRARRMGLSADPHLASLRRSAARRRARCRGSDDAGTGW